MATIHYVKTGGTGDGTSWAQASGSLEDMLEAAQGGDEIWIAAGTYKPTRLLRSNKEHSFSFVLKNGVSLYGGFAGTEMSKDERLKGDRAWDFLNETVLSGEDDEPDVWVREIQAGSTYRYTWQMENEDNMEVKGTTGNNNHILYTTETLTLPTEINGLTLRGGNANVWNVKAAGGALYAAGNVQLRECQVLQNSAYFTAQATTGSSDTYGGAVFLNGAEGALIEDCYFARNYCHSKWGNSWGGAIYAGGINIRRCEFSDCVSLDNGGAVALASGTISECLFTDCYASAGGALVNLGEAHHNTILNCRGLLGGGLYNMGAASYNIVAGCYADAPEFGEAMGGQGGGVYQYSGMLLGSVVYNNQAFAGGGVHIRGGRVVNCTVQHNALRTESSEANVAVYTDGDGVASTTLEASLFNSIANPDADAANFQQPTTFIGLPADDSQQQELQDASWALASGSAFIDAGTLTDGITEDTDIAGNSRVAGNAIDVGAYESLTTGLPSLSVSPIARIEYYMLDGRQLSSQPRKGACISRTVSTDGRITIRKIVRN